MPSTPLAEAFAIDAARVHAVHVTPSWPEALRAPAVVVDCVHRLREQLSDSKSWSVREAGLRVTLVVAAVVVVAAATAATVVAVAVAVVVVAMIAPILLRMLVWVSVLVLATVHEQ